MSDSEDREEQSSQKEERWLPPRLRAKLDEAPDDDDDDDAPRRSSPVGLIITILVVVGVVAGGWFMWQNYQAEQKAEAERVAAERARVVADSLAAIARADSIAEAARQDSIAAFEALSPREKRRVLAEIEARARAAAGGGAAASRTPSGSSGGGAPAAPAPEPVESGPFALDAGQFLFEDAAQRAAGELQTATGLDATVRPVGSGENQTFHVYLGRFSGRAAAEKAANELIANGSVAQARVVRAP